MNQSKKHDPRMWKKWEQSGALGKRFVLKYGCVDPAYYFASRDYGERKEFNTLEELVQYARKRDKTYREHDHRLWPPFIFERQGKEYQRFDQERTAQVIGRNNYY